MENYFVTGNEYISIPTIREDASIESINFLHMGHRGLIEICGEPIIKPVFEINSAEKNICSMRWKYEEYWIPQFDGRIDEIEIHGEIFAPLGCRGFIYNIEVLNCGLNTDITVGLSGVWNSAVHSINESKIIDGSKYIYNSGWNNGPMFDFRNGITMFSFGYLCSFEPDTKCWGKNSGDLTASSSEPVGYRITKTEHLKTGESARFTFFVGIGLEEVGAAASAIDMKRSGCKYLFEETKKWLKGKTKTTGDEVLDKLFNLNLFFNYFYASGKTIDTEERVLVTSRSPRYYVSAAYWDRDSLIWSFPSLVLVDRDAAREALYYVFEKQIRNIGIHSRYIDGTVLEPGFELDELCAPIIALEEYINKTNEWEILNESSVRKGIYKILGIIDSKKHADEYIYETFLQPTDDMRIYPYLTYNSVLVWKVFNTASVFLGFIGDEEGKKKYKEYSVHVKKAVTENCIINREGKSIYAWAVDLNGGSMVYDEPPGSLTLIPYYGFTDYSDEVYKNTFDMLYSRGFKHYFSDGSFKELGCSHADHPWVLSIANSLLNGRKSEALDMLRRAPLDNGIACESIDENTGECATGAHFATCAGFLCHAIYQSCIAGKDN